MAFVQRGQVKAGDTWKQIRTGIKVNESSPSEQSSQQMEIEDEHTVRHDALPEAQGIAMVIYCTWFILMTVQCAIAQMDNYIA